MKEGPDIAAIAALIGDPGRANMLSALMSGKALTATELAFEAGITAQTASAHLAKLEAGGLLAREKQGRHRYFRLLDEDVAHVLEALMGLAAKRGKLRSRTGPRDPELRHARVCYQHLAGEMGVQMYDSLRGRGFLDVGGDGLNLTGAGQDMLVGIGIDIAGLGGQRGPLCRECLDWSARRSHLAGSLGRALLRHVYGQGWAKQVDGSRIVRFSARGKVAFGGVFGVA
ncbi:MAG: helix-turn-helix transcriptional regulator [Paracoccaceae bacterium]